MKLLIKLLTFSSMIQRCRGHLSPRIVSPLPLLIKQTLLEALPSTYSETFPMTFIIRKIHLSSFLQIFFFFSITFYPVRFEIYISLSSLFLIFMNIRLETMFERLTLPLPPPPAWFQTCNFVSIYGSHIRLKRVFLEGTGPWKIARSILNENVEAR